MSWGEYSGSYSSDYTDGACLLELGTGTGTLVGLSSTSEDQSGSNPIVTISENATESADTLTGLYGGNIQDAITAVAVVGGVTGLASAISGGPGGLTEGIDETSGSTPDPDTLIRFHNDVPYSRVEQRAEQVYANLHRDKQYTPSFPVVIAETKEKMEVAQAFFGGDLSVITDRLELAERLLKETEKKDEIVT